MHEVTGSSPVVPTICSYSEQQEKSAALQRIFLFEEEPESIADAVFFGKRENRGKGCKFAETGNTHVHVAESTVFTAPETPETGSKEQA